MELFGYRYILHHIFWPHIIFLRLWKNLRRLSVPPDPKLCRLPTKSHQSHRQHYYFAGILCHLCNITLSYCTITWSYYFILCHTCSHCDSDRNENMLEDSLGQDRVVGLLEFDNQSIVHTTSNPIFLGFSIFFWRESIKYLVLMADFLGLVTLCILHYAYCIDFDPFMLIAHCLPKGADIGFPSDNCHW